MALVVDPMLYIADCDVTDACGVSLEVQSDSLVVSVAVVVAAVAVIALSAAVSEGEVSKGDSEFICVCS